jgi:hypothetical protein
MVEIELLGVARFLARQETVSLDLPRTTSVADVLLRLADAAPALVGNVLTEHGELVGGYVLARGATELLRDPEAPVHPGDRLLLLSTTAGG